MTAITLNLLAEEFQAEHARARDPVKVALAIGASLIALTVACGAMVNVAASRKHGELVVLQGRWNEHQKAMSGVNSGFADAKQQAEELVNINRGRSLCAPQLALIKDLVPETISLTRVGLVLNTEIIATLAAPEAVAVGDAPKGKPKRGPLSAGSIRHLVMQIEGKATSARPEIEVDNFLQTLHSTPAFSDQVKQIQLRSIAHGAGAAGDPTALPNAIFVIECQFKEKS